MKCKSIRASVLNEASSGAGRRIMRLTARLARQSVATLVSGLLVLQPMLVQAQVAPDTSAPIGNQPGVGTAPNGVPLVDIVTPNGQGLSHNKYHDFNVGTPGLILNNHDGTFGTSKLGGNTPGNPNLTNSGPASVILNEVTSGNRSALEGATEVFGHHADVIIANPNGITCDGCGFINTPRATLTTGTPDIDGTGRLTGFTVQGGDVTFAGKGGDFKSNGHGVDLFDIVSRHIQIDGQVNAKNLRLTAGRQKFNYATGEATALSSEDDAGAFAIDGSALGAMQADRIKIVVTDKGAGVRMRNDMAANAGELTLSADGKISLGVVKGRDGVDVRSKSQKVEAKTVTSQKHVDINASKGITLDTISAEEEGVHVDSGTGLLSATGNIHGFGLVELTSAGAIDVRDVTSKGEVILQASSGISAAQVNADRSTRISSGSGNIVLSDQARAGGGALNITATSGSISAASLISFKNIRLSAGQDIHIGDAILSGGTLVASAASIKATSAVSGVDFAATETAGGSLRIGKAGEMQLATTGNVDVSSLLSAGNLKISATSLTGKALTSHGMITIAGDTTVSGQLLGSGDVSIAGTNIRAGTIASGVDFAGSKVASKGGIVVGNAGNLDLRADNGTIDVATLLSAGNLLGRAAAFKAANITTHGATKISGATAISGQLLSGSNIFVSGPSITLGTAIAGVDPASLKKGNIIPGHAGNLSLTATATAVTADRLIAAGDTAVTASSTVTANIVSHGDLMITADDAIVLSGQSLAGGKATLKAGSINIATLVSGVDFAATEKAGGALVLAAGQGGQTVLTASDRIDAGTLLSAGSLEVNAGTFNATNVTSNDSATITGNTTISGQLLAGSDVSVTGPAINIATVVAGVDLSALANGNIVTGSNAHALSLMATAGDIAVTRLSSSGDVVASATGNLSANALAHGDLDLTAGSVLALYGQSLAAGDAVLRAGTMKIGTLVSGVDFVASEQSGGALILKTSASGGIDTGQVLLTASGRIDAQTLRSAGLLTANAGTFNAANVTSHGAATITGDTTISGQLLAGGDIAVTGQAINLAATVAGADLAQLAKGNIILGDAAHALSLTTTAGDLTVNRMLSSGDTAASATGNLSANVLSHGNIDLSAGGTLALSGQSLAGGNATLNADAITIGALVSGVDFAATEQAGGAMILKSSAASATGATSAAGAANTGLMTLAAKGSIDATMLLSSGALVADAGTFNAANVTSHDTATIMGDTTISGQLLAGSDIAITGPAIHLGAAVAGVDLAVLASGQIIPGQAGNLGLIATVQGVTADRLMSAGNMAVTAQSTVTANVISHGDLGITAGDMITLTGQSLTGGDATIRAGAITIDTLVSGVDFAATQKSGGALILKSGRNPAADATSATSATGATSAAGVTDTGRAPASQDTGTLTLAASNGSIVADQLVSGGDLKAKAQQDITYNSLRSFASADLDAVMGTISLDHDTIARGDIALTLQSLDLSNDRSKLATAGTLIVNAANANLANSTLTFGGIELSLTGSANASNAKIRAVTGKDGSGDITIAATTVVTTAKTAILAAHDLTLTLASLTNSGQIAANRDLAFKISGDLTNTPTGLIYAGHDGRLFVNGNILNDQGAILTGNDLAFANAAGNGKNASFVNRNGLVQSGRNLSILTSHLKNEASGEPVIGERQEQGPRRSFEQPQHAQELWDNDTPMRGRLFYDARENIKWGRGGCSEKRGDPCDVTWLDKGLWNSKEDTYGHITLPDGTVYKAFAWNKAGSNDGKGKIWYDWNSDAALAEQSRTQYFISRPSTPGLIQAGGTLDINATTIDNFYSSIEAGGDARITSDHLTNKGITLYHDVYMTCLAGPETCYGYNADDSRNSSADISAGSSVLIDRHAVDSLASVIRSGGALTMTVGKLDNSATDGSIAGHSHYEARPSTSDPLAALGGLTAGGALFTPNPALSGLLAGKGISVSGDTLQRTDDNGQVGSGEKAGPGLTVSNHGFEASGVPLQPAEIMAALGTSAPKPSSGGFGGTVAGQVFIYETRAEFLDVSKFYGSGYFLNRIGYQPDRKILFLGDAYFENQLIDRQMRQAMGYGLNRIGNPVEQMKSLLDNGADYAKSHGLRFGEPLSSEQIAALDRSIVVYVKQNVGGVAVLAPVLYVSAKDKGKAVASGSMIEGNMVVVSGGTVNNSGLIASNTSLNVQATTITASGGGFAAKGDLRLAANDTITLNAGTTRFNGQTVIVPTAAVTSGGNAAIQSGHNVNLNGVKVTAGQSLAVSGDNVNIATATGTSADGSQTVTGSKLQSGADTSIVGKNNITVSGSNITAGGDLGLTAENGNLTIQSAEANRHDGFGETTTQQKSALSSGGSTNLEADKNIVIAGSDVKAGKDLAINAGEGIAVIATQDKANGSFGSNSFVTTTQQGSNLSSGSDTSVKAGSDILIGGSSIGAGKNLDLNARGDVNIVAMADTSEEHTNGRIFQRTETETTAVGSSLKAGGDLSATAGNDVNIVGSKLEANGKAVLGAGHDVNILAAENSHDLDASFSEKSSGPFGKKRSWTKDEHETTTVGSSIRGKDGVDITSGNNTTIAASKVQAGTDDHKADLNINAGGDLIIASGKDTSEHDASKSKSGFLSKKSDKTHTYDETTVASELSASGNVNLNADKNVAIAGSKVKAGDNIAIEGESVSIIGAQERHESATSSKKSGIGVGSGNGLYSVYGKEQKSSSENIVANAGSQLSAGNDVSIKARESDVNIVGSKVDAKNDINLEATRDVNILPGAESYASEEKEKRSGFGLKFGSGNGSASMGLGFGSSKDETTQAAETNAVSSLNAGRDVIITAGRDANLQAAQVEAGSTVDILAERDVNLLAAQDKTNYEHMHQELFAGVTAQVSSGLASAAKGLADSAEAAASKSGSQAVANAAMAALYANKLKEGLEQIGEKGLTSLSASVSAGFQTSTSKTKSESSSPVVTTIRGGDSVTIEAKTGDINSHGAQILAGRDRDGGPTTGSGDIALTAGNAINLNSAVATGNTSSKGTSLGAGVGLGADVTVGANGVSIGEAGLSVTANGSKSSATQDTVTNINTHVAGLGEVTLKSGNDINLKGAVVSG
ncbi:hypothetical protein CQ054_19985, partial [Ochrobactrum sp. MYb29]